MADKKNLAVSTKYQSLQNMIGNKCVACGRPAPGVYKKNRQGQTVFSHYPPHCKRCRMDAIRAVNDWARGKITLDDLVKFRPTKGQLTHPNVISGFVDRFHNSSDPLPFSDIHFVEFCNGISKDLHERFWEAVGVEAESRGLGKPDAPNSNGPAGATISATDEELDQTANGNVLKKGEKPSEKPSTE